MSRNPLARLTNDQLHDVALKLVQRDPTAGWAPVMQELMLCMATPYDQGPDPVVDVDTLRANLARLRTINGEALQLAARLQELITTKKGA